MFSFITQRLRVAPTISCSLLCNGCQNGLLFLFLFLHWNKCCTKPSQWVVLQRYWGWYANALALQASLCSFFRAPWVILVGKSIISEDSHLFVCFFKCLVSKPQWYTVHLETRRFWVWFPASSYYKNGTHGLPAYHHWDFSSNVQLSNVKLKALLKFDCPQLQFPPDYVMCLWVIASN